MSSNQEYINKGLFYRLAVKINPDSYQINAEVSIMNPPDAVFYINNDFKILSITANGKTLPFHLLPDETLPLTVGTAVSVDGEYTDELVVEYSGTISNVVSNVNMIQPNLVELAFYAAWYPMYKGIFHFDFEIILDLPSTFITTTNGIQLKKQVVNDRTISKWSSSDSCFDIVILAAPTLKMLEHQKMGTRIELFQSQVPEAYMLEKMNVLETAIQRLAHFYGPAKTGGFLRCVNSPRVGWGYSRVPLIVIPEEYILSQSDQEYGRARIFHGIFHELAHFWWLISDPNTPGDWINEGLAEFSAYRLSEEFFGSTFASLLVKEYKEHIAIAQNNMSIAETTATSEDRYVNRYEKTTLLYIEAQQRYGKQTLDGLCRTMYNHFAQSVDATTDDFMKEVRNQMGSEAAQFFKTVLYQKEWTDPGKLP